MKKYLLIVTILSIVPSVTFASWWNPLDWFGSNNSEKKSAQQIAIPEKQMITIQQRSSVTEPMAQAPVSSSTTEITPMRADNLSVNDDSKLTSQINTLTAQNNSLKSKLITVQNQLAAIQNNYATCQANLLKLQSRGNSMPAQAVQPATEPSIREIKIVPVAILLDDSTPRSTSVATNNGRYLDLPVLTFNIRPSGEGQAVDSLVVDISSSGSGIINTASLYGANFTTPIATAIVSNGKAVFSLHDNAYSSLSNMTYPYNVFRIKLNISGLGDKGSSQSLSASVSNIKVIDSKGQNVDVTGAAQGNIITVSGTTTKQTF